MLCEIGNALVICGSYPSDEIRSAIDKHVGGQNKIACITSDPPYGFIVNEEWDKHDPSNLYYNIMMESKKELLPGGSLLIWGGIGKPNSRPFFKSIIEAEKDGLIMKNMITWSKKRAYGKKNDYLFTREELAWFVWDEKLHTFNIPLLEEKRGYPGFSKKYPAKSEYKRRTNVWTDITEILRGKKHPTEKPVKLYEVIYSTHSNPGDTVMDICGGSGVAAIAALSLGRNIIVVEQDEQWFDFICNRIKEYYA